MKLCDCRYAAAHPSKRVALWHLAYRRSFRASLAHWPVRAFLWGQVADWLARTHVRPAA